MLTQPVDDSNRANRGWRSEVLAQATSLRTELVLAGREHGFTVDFDAKPPTVTRGRASVAEAELAESVVDCIETAESYAGIRPRPAEWLAGSHLEGAWSRLHVAEEILVELMARARLASYVPVAAYLCRREMTKGDPRRVAVEGIAKGLAKKPPLVLGDVQRGAIRDALRGVHYRNAKRYRGARALRNLNYGFAALFVFIAVAAIVVNAFRPTTLPMCLEADPAAAVEEPAPSESPSVSPSPSPSPTGEPQICATGGPRPTGGDVPLVVVLGMSAALISAARALTGKARRVGPYSTVVAQGTLKVSLGALVAVAGVTLLRAGWVPGVDDVDTGSEIVAWALLFGYAQQAFTGLLDQRAAKTLSAPEGGEPAPAADLADGGGQEGEAKA